MAPKPKRAKNKDNARRSKKKISILNSESVDYVDYKDVNLLRRFMSDRAKIRARRVTGNDAQQQATIAMAIKNAREMALLPYANRVTQQRGGRGGERGDRGIRADGPPPRPAWAWRSWWRARRPWHPGRWPAAASHRTSAHRW